MNRSTIHNALLALLTFGAAAALASCSENETPPPGRSQYVGNQPNELSCTPNLDGKIEARELAPSLGVAATYIVSPAGQDRQIDLVGAQRDGKTVWTFADIAGDQVAKIQATSLQGKWYAASFPNLESPFVTPIDVAGQTEGVYTHNESAFTLHGIASASAEGNKTLLVYKTPIVLYRFPLTPGIEYTSTGEVENGEFRGLPYAGRDMYEIKVDAAGEVALPDFTVTQAMRVRTKVTVSPAAGQVTTQRQTSFLFECLGEVVRATSKLEEPDENFKTAAEVRKLGLAP